MTNYEKIKAMCVEEMAEYFSEFTPECEVSICAAKDVWETNGHAESCYSSSDTCAQAVKEWLESEAEEND